MDFQWALGRGSAPGGLCPGAGGGGDKKTICTNLNALECAFSTSNRIQKISDHILDPPTNIYLEEMATLHRVHLHHGFYIRWLLISLCAQLE